MRGTSSLRFLAISILLLVSGSALCVAPAAQHDTTDWLLRPSLKYDTLCLLNVLSGDPYYLHYYQKEYDHFHPLFHPREQLAFEQLKDVIKDQGEGIVSARLTLYYSVVNDETLPEMIKTAQDSSSMETALKATSYWNDSEWKNYDEARPALVTALQALNRVGFTEYWEHEAKPGVEKRIAELSSELPKYNIVPAIEKDLGFPLASNTITVYLLAYSEPHGIRITGERFLTHESYPFRIVLRNAIHESMHPPFDKHDPAVAQAIDTLGQDPLIADKVKHHDPSFGYNTADGYIEEDSVQALEEIISEQFSVGHNPQNYWKEQDGGMHVLATAIYVDYKEALKHGPRTFSHWFIRAVEDGELRGEKLQNTVEIFFATTK